MTSLTSTAQGPTAALRQGRSRACDEYQCKITPACPRGPARWVSALVMTNGSSHSHGPSAAEGGRYRPPHVLYFPHIGQRRMTRAPSIAGLARAGYTGRAGRHDGPPEAHAPGLGEPAGHARHPPHLARESDLP